MLKIFAISLLLAFTSIAQAQTQKLAAQTFEDQWDKPQVLNETIEWVIFTHEMDGGVWVKDSLHNLEVSDLANKNWIYIADISGMPSLIGRLFALPKMRDYKFPMALAREEEMTADWPKKEDYVVVYKMDNLKIVDQYFFKDQVELQGFIKTNYIP